MNLPPEIFDAGLSSSEFKTIVAMHHLATPEGRVDVSKDELTILTGFSAETLRRAFRGLESAGLLETTRGPSATWASGPATFTRLFHHHTILWKQGFYHHTVPRKSSLHHHPFWWKTGNHHHTVLCGQQLVVIVMKLVT